MAVLFSADTDGLSVCANRLEEHPTERIDIDNLILSEFCELVPSYAWAPLYLLVMPAESSHSVEAGMS